MGKIISVEQNSSSFLRQFMVLIFIFNQFSIHIAISGVMVSPFSFAIMNPPQCQILGATRSFSVTLDLVINFFILSSKLVRRFPLFSQEIRILSKIEKLKTLVKLIATQVAIETLREKYPYSELFWWVYSVSLPIQSECGKIRTKIIANTDTFYTVKMIKIF